MFSRKEAVLDPCPRKDERELADLAQGETGQKSRAERKAQEADGQSGHAGLQRQDKKGGQGDLKKLGSDKREIQKHAHGDEKEGEEDLLEGKDLSQSLGAVFGFGDDQPGQEGPQSQGKPRQRSEPGRSQAQGHGSQEEDLPVPGPRHPKEEPGDHPTGRHQNQGNDEDGLSQEPDKGPQNVATPQCQEGSEEHHGNDGHVLEDQNPQSRLPLRGVDLSPFLKKTEDNGRAGKGDQHPHEDRFDRRLPEGLGHEEYGCTGEAHLEGAAQDHRPPDPHQASQGELYADGEEKEDHPHFGEELHLVDSSDQPQPMGPGYDPGEEEAQNQGNPGPLEKEDHPQR